MARSRSALSAENLFLRKQLALFQERRVKPSRADDSTRWMMAALSRLFDWRGALVAVQADTLVRWHRKGFRLFWRWKSKPTGRPRLPKNLQELIRIMSAENPSWGQERIANELMLKLGIQVSPRSVQKYLNTPGPNRNPDPKQLADLCPESRPRHRGDGLACCRDGPVPYPLCICMHRVGHPANSPLQRDGASDCGVDLACSNSVRR
jgi:hypothetical protein